MECLFSSFKCGVRFLRDSGSSWLLGGSSSRLSALLVARGCSSPACSFNDHENALELESVWLPEGVPGAEPEHDEAENVRLGTGDIARSGPILDLLATSFSREGILTSW